MKARHTLVLACAVLLLAVNTLLMYAFVFRF